jgi:UDPglucose 6-dehydrogenase
MLREALWVVRDKTIAVLGLSFKANTDDIREAPSLRVIGALLEEGAHLRLYDPKAIPNMRQAFPEDDSAIRYAEDPYEAVRGADAMVVLTEWDEVRSLDLEKVRRIMRTPIVADGRNVFEPCAVQAAGLEYYGFGRPTGRALVRVDLPLVRQASGVHGLA